MTFAEWWVTVSFTFLLVMAAKQYFVRRKIAATSGLRTATLRLVGRPDIVTRMKEIAADFEWRVSEEEFDQGSKSFVRVIPDTESALSKRTELLVALEQAGLVCNVEHIYYSEASR